jgi:hypothetical protein
MWLQSRTFNGVEVVATAFRRLGVYRQSQSTYRSLNLDQVSVRSVSISEQPPMHHVSRLFYTKLPMPIFSLPKQYQHACIVCNLRRQAQRACLYMAKLRR